MQLSTESKEKELALLKKEYSYLLNNPALNAICMWKDPLDYIKQSQPEQTEEQYVARCESNLPAIKKIMDSINGNSISDFYRKSI